MVQIVVDLGTSSCIEWRLMVAPVVKVSKCGIYLVRRFFLCGDNSFLGISQNWRYTCHLVRNNKAKLIHVVPLYTRENRGNRQCLIKSMTRKGWASAFQISRYNKSRFYKAHQSNALCVLLILVSRVPGFSSLFKKIGLTKSTNYKKWLVCSNISQIMPYLATTVLEIPRRKT